MFAEIAAVTRSTVPEPFAFDFGRGASYLLSTRSIDLIAIIYVIEMAG
jgi:hypothetical protein